MSVIYREVLNDQLRLSVPARIFGVNFPLILEPTVFTMAERLSPDDYRGGLWEFYLLCNGGFYMAPRSDRRFGVASENGFLGEMSADALGLTVCLYAYSTLSLRGIQGLSEGCAEQFHRVRAYMLDHDEAGAILAAID